MHTILKQFSKFNTIMAAAGLMTLGLFYSMQLLIMSDGQVPSIKETPIIQDITMPEWIVDIVRITPRPPEIEKPPEIPQELIRSIDDKPVIGPVFTGIAEGTTVEVRDNLRLGPADSNAMPIAQIQPTYPTRAAEKGIEGFVLVQFDVNETGSVVNPEILGADPPGIFDRAAIRALERWKYQPKVVNGKAIKMIGLQTRFTFNLRE